jgi:phage tail-like protein
MALPDFDAGVGHSFGLEVGNIVIKQIQEITGLKKEQDVIEMKSNTNDGKYMIKKLPGRWKAGEVTLTRGLTADNSFEQWIKNSELGNMSAARQGGAIIVYDFMGAPIKRYKLENAWPKSLEISNLKAGDTTVLTEKLVITYEQMEVDDS